MRRVSALLLAFGVLSAGTFSLSAGAARRPVDATQPLGRNSLPKPSGHKRALRSTSVLFLGLILALGAIGVVNGLWSQNLTVNGIVATGDLNADWADLTTDDYGLEPDQCSVVGNGSRIATASITNALPGYVCTISGGVNNTGSIPFNIIGANLVINNGNDAGLEAYSNPACTVPASAQVDPGSAGQISCTVKLKEGAHPAELGKKYYFGIEVCVAQWNEASTFTACKTSPQHEGPGSIVLPAPGPATPP